MSNWLTNKYGLFKNKNEQILPQDITWMNPENVMLSPITQSQKTTYCRIPLI